MSRFLRALFVVGALLAVAGQLRPTEAATDYVALIKINGAIDESSDRFLSRAIDQATDDQARLALIEIDTPGGLLSSTRSMVESILNAEIPVAVYVAPRGARAGSAGTFITAAGNFAVMAPGTNIGAASPISSTGEDIPSTLAKKINQDTQAFIRSIADVRGRNADALEETVTLARSYTAEEAIALNVVDLIASDRFDLLEQIEGLTAETAAGPVVVQTQDVPIREIGKNLLEQFLAILGNPSVAGILISMGSIALLIEFYTSGIGPGVAGVIMLALGFLGAGQLPLNWVALGLIIFAMVLFFLELQAPGLGIFVIGGVISLSVGLFFLFGNFSGPPDIAEPGTQVSPWVIGAFIGTGGALLLLLIFLSRSTGYVYTGKNQTATLVGQEGLALGALEPGGQVVVGGQEWTASAPPGSNISPGDRVRVVSVLTNLLRVTPVDVTAEVAEEDAKALVGQHGVALSDLAPSGRVRVADVAWTATTEIELGIKEGSPIQVESASANILKVGPPSSEPPPLIASNQAPRPTVVRSLLGQVARIGKIFKLS